MLLNALLSCRRRLILSLTFARTASTGRISRMGWAALGAVALAICLLACYLFGGIGSTPGNKVAGGETSAVSGWSTMPLAFEPNAGQTDPAVRFVAHGNGGTAFLTPSQLVVSLRDQAVLRIAFTGATGAATLRAGQLQEGK